MLTYNEVTILGHVGKDPEIRVTPQGKTVANFGVATSERWTDKTGQTQERTEWFEVVAWEKLATIVGDYVQRGTVVFVKGRQQTDKWVDKQGTNRETKKVKASTVIVVGRGKTGNAGDTEDMAESLTQGEKELPF